MSKKALIFGVTGQDGSYLSELLLEKDYTVIGVNRRTSTDNTSRLHEIKNSENFMLIDGDITDPSSVNRIIGDYQPDECYNLAAQSHVGISFEQPSVCMEVNTLGVLYILEAIKLISPSTRFLQAGSSEEFGNHYKKIPYWNNGQLGNPLYDIPDGYTKIQDEETPLSPNSPYAVSKVAAHHLVKIYREAYNLHASVSISMNHESPRRGDNFVTRKITKWLGEFKTWKCQFDNYVMPEGGDQIAACNYANQNVYYFPKLRLGNLSAKRDWGHAKDVVRGMWLMMQKESPGDYILATGETHSVEDFLTAAFSIAGIDNWRQYVYVDQDLYRPVEVPYLLGDNTKAKEQLGWTPEITFNQLVTEMVRSDYNHAKKET